MQKIGLEKAYFGERERGVDPESLYSSNFISGVTHKKKSEIRPISKFIEVFKKLHINLSLVDPLTHMPNYAKFLKDIISNKRKLDDGATVKLNEECFAILQTKLPPKLKDLGSFTILRQIVDMLFSKALCDLRARINLVPYPVYMKLGVGEIKDTTMSLQLVDRSIKYPRGIVENVLVKVDKFVFLVDFVILKMEAKVEVSIILGRPFLATRGALVDVRENKLVLRLCEEKVTFNNMKTIKHLSQYKDVWMINTIDNEVEYMFKLNNAMDSLLNVMVQQIKEGLRLEDKTNVVKYLEANKLWWESLEPWPPPSS